MADPYIDEVHGVLHNKADLVDPEGLARYEADCFRLRMLELVAIEPTIESYRDLHRHLFQDVYEWAGEFRTIPLAKQDFVDSLNITRFTPPSEIVSSLESVMENLREAKCFGELSRESAATAVAHLLADLNDIHPFREGNGRIQRRFVEWVATQSGHPVEFLVVSREWMLVASIQASRGDRALMERMFDQIMDEPQITRLKSAIAALEQFEKPWTQWYVCGMVAGQRYEGAYVGRDAISFMLKDADDRVLVGDPADLPGDCKSGDTIVVEATR